MTVKELYERCVENGLENAEIMIDVESFEGPYFECVHTKNNVCDVEYFNKDEDKPERVVLYV